MLEKRPPIEMSRWVAGQLAAGKMAAVKWQRVKWQWGKFAAGSFGSGQMATVKWQRTNGSGVIWQRVAEFAYEVKFKLI